MYACMICIVECAVACHFDENGTSITRYYDGIADVNSDVDDDYGGHAEIGTVLVCA